MGRPIKQGLDYFPLDVDCDDKVELLEAKHGIVGFGVLIKLWQKIYKNGYYIDWNEEMLLLLKKQINVDINLISEIINDCTRWNIFNAQLYKKYNILTSSGIQKRYIAASDRRTVINIYEEYFLIDSNIDSINFVNVDKKPINDDTMITETGLVQAKSTQRKGKEIKEKERRVKQFIPPSLEDVVSYCKERKNNIDPVYFYDFFEASGWIDSKGNPVKSWKQKIITWESYKDNRPQHAEQPQTEQGGANF